MKKLLISLSLILTLAGCGSLVEHDESSDEKEKIEVVEGTKEVEGSVDELSREGSILIAQSIMSDNFEGVASVSYDGVMDAITILPMDEEFTTEIYHMLTGEMSNDAWNSLVYTTSMFSVTVAELVDKNISVAILNPADSDRVLLLVQNGYVMYDFSDEI